MQVNSNLLQSFFENYAQNKPIGLADCALLFQQVSGLPSYKVTKLNYSDLLQGKFVEQHNVYSCLAINQYLPASYRASYQDALRDMTDVNTAELEGAERFTIFKLQKKFRDYFDFEGKVVVFPENRQWQIQSRNRHHNGYSVCNCEAW